MKSTDMATMHKNALQTCRDQDGANAIPLSVPQLAGNEWQYVKSCLDSGWVSSVGPFVDRFEREVAACAKTRFAVATASGTAALHVALLIAGVEPDDEVLVSTLTFVATANAVRYAGAHPVFIDAEPRHWQLDVELVDHFLRTQCERRSDALYNRQSGRRVRAIVPVHILGHPVDMQPLLDLAEEFGLQVIEDAAEGLGTKYRGRLVGSLGNLGCFSFNGNKIVTTGGGGAIVTDDEELARRARHLTTQAKCDNLEYIHDEVGFNYRLNNVSAAIGCAQLEQLPQCIEAKRGHAQHYRRTLAGIDGAGFFEAADDAFCTYWLSAIRVDSAQTGIDCRQLAAMLRKRNIETRPLWQPMHHSPAHCEAQAITTGVAERLYAECLLLPSSVGLSAEDRERVSDAIVEALA